MRPSYAIFLCLATYTAEYVGAFTVPQPTVGITSNPLEKITVNDSFIALNMAPKDPSRSGTKTDRMDKLAEMERMGSANSDNSVFVQAAGAFAALIVIAIAVAASSGLLTQY